ncbi:hypothetical protein [Methylocella sp.]|uniref:hypothetical protein n=1 Tax=Methylocella sp. TaxID=1978226 RepID=UPI0037833F0A
MSRLARWTKNFATVAAFAAAYALVLQIVLTGALAASLPQDAGGGLRLCAADAPADSGEHAPSRPHCLSCLCRLDAAALPPPPAAPVIDRFAIELHFEIALWTALHAGASASPVRARGPPAAA